jgi:uncharacterized protein YdhG (YjbR/CyaY superfamily)
MKRKANKKTDFIEPGGVEEYIERCPKGIQPRLKAIRSAIRGAAPGSTETVSYFRMPGYCYPGYDYNGMFAWFSFKAPCVRLHVRPPVLGDNIKHLRGYALTKAIISFPANKAIPKALVQKLVKASIKEMKRKRQPDSTSS